MFVQCDTHKLLYDYWRCRIRSWINKVLKSLNKNFLYSNYIAKENIYTRWSVQHRRHRLQDIICTPLKDYQLKLWQGNNQAVA